MVHNGESPNFKGLLFDKKTNYLAQILQSLSYKVCSIILPKFNTFGLFIPILGTSAIMDQTACCYNVTRSETGLYLNHYQSMGVTRALVSEDCPFTVHFNFVTLPLLKKLVVLLA